MSAVTLPTVPAVRRRGRVAWRIGASLLAVAALLWGTLSFVNNAVDMTTGTIQLKATFDNVDNALWPGQFATVTLTVRTELNALVVPSQAIQAGQKGQ